MTVIVKKRRKKTTQLTQGTRQNAVSKISQHLYHYKGDKIHINFFRIIVIISILHSSYLREGNDICIRSYSCWERALVNESNIRMGVTQMFLYVCTNGSMYMCAWI